MKTHTRTHNDTKQVERIIGPILARRFAANIGDEACNALLAAQAAKRDADLAYRDLIDNIVRDMMND